MAVNWLYSLVIILSNRSGKAIIDILADEFENSFLLAALFRQPVQLAL